MSNSLKDFTKNARRGLLERFIQVLDDTEVTSENFGEIIRIAVDDCYFSKPQLASGLDVGLNTIYRWYRKEKIPRSSTTQKAMIDALRAYVASSL